MKKHQASWGHIYNSVNSIRFFKEKNSHFYFRTEWKCAWLLTQNRKSSLKNLKETCINRNVAIEFNPLSVMSHDRGFHRLITTELCVLTLTLNLSAPGGGQGRNINPRLGSVWGCIPGRIPGGPACTVPFSLDHSSPCCLWTPTFSPSLCWGPS